MKRPLGKCAALLTLLAMVGMFTLPPAHSHASSGPVPVVESDPCAGGGVHLHAAHTHEPAPCPACAAGPAPTAAPVFSASQPRPSEQKLCAGLSPVSLAAPSVRHARTRAPPADRL